VSQIPRACAPEHSSFHAALSQAQVFLPVCIGPSPFQNGIGVAFACTYTENSFVFRTIDRFGRRGWNGSNARIRKVDMTNPEPNAEDQAAASVGRHSRWTEFFFQARVMRQRIRRGISDFFSRLRRCEKMHDGPYSLVAGESRSKLWSDDRSAEAYFQEGKVQNLRVAVRQLDCALLLPGQVFSFWVQIGRATEERGFVTGRMLQQGCMIPAVGGGLCQLSNALYDAALQSGCEIVERHAHSRVVPGSAAAAGRDATVAWNYVDLRFRSQVPLLIRARVTEDELVVSFCAFPGTVVPNKNMAAAGEHATDSEADRARELASTCATCAEARCFRHENPEKVGSF
jgi:VanW like protein